MENLGGGALQSWEWGEFRRTGGWDPLRLLDEDGGFAAQVLLRRMAFGLGSFAYVPHGPVCSSADLAGQAAEELAGYLLGQTDASLLVVEPRVEEGQGFEARGFEKSASSVQPRCTFILDVLPDEDAQLSALPKDARYSVRRARKEGVEVSNHRGASGELEGFLDLLEETSERQGFAIRPREYYRLFMQKLPATLVCASHQGRLLCGAIILCFGEEAYYLYGASASSERLYASYLVQFEALTVARRHGARRYDMWGPCRPTEGDPLLGVYRFKKKFGGEEKHYVGAHERALHPLRARLTHTALDAYYHLQRLRGRSQGPVAG
ncbi:lipid II:glycine glycyltransferase FemX [Rubrobacter calidifluminis]|uniref:lipid II:glycine glycyltransferase FemX n=1 Tax=Rubrobacter calidifluminis TaxID=1392640 RepID=UPI002360A5BF|nr:peptidoglycan bridge formation glycyltransferase FemA/FemB family protein [Rubrobacter calidifluminis]